MLSEALEALGESHLSSIVIERHSRKEEITEDCMNSKQETSNSSSESLLSASCRRSMSRSGSDMYRYGAIVNRQPLV